jgi:TolB protein
MFKKIAAAAVLISVSALHAKTVVDVTGVGREKIPVQINVSNQAFARSLKKNLELSGLFVVKSAASIKVSGAPGAISASGMGRTVASQEAFADEKSARMAARRLSDSMCQAYGNQKGFACDRIAFVSRKSKDNSELCVCYPDGYDIRQLTGNGKTVVGPRWKDANTIFYTGIVNAGPQVWEYDCAAGRRTLRWSFKGLTTGACVSPDGRKAAVILSFQGNPELYVIDMPTGKWVRMTNTPLASEGQPAWSPDGSKIVYVSDETRHPQLYVIDVASKAKRRLTSKGSQNVDPDWGADGRIAYITKRGGAQIAVIDPAKGESSAKLVTEPGNWEHPSWSRDSRNLVASRDRALFVVDTEMQGDVPSKPMRVFHAEGNWITPSWSK